jgi:hypothetical protein
VLFTNYYSGDLIKKTWAGHVARMEERKGECRALVDKPEIRRPLGRPRRR